MRAYLQKEIGEWAFDFVFTSKQAAIDLGYEIVACDTVKGFDFNHPNIDEDICIGSVEFTEMFFEACEVEIPKYVGYPESLIDNYDIMGRMVSECKVSDMIDYEYPYFIKPSKEVKLFTGDVITNDSQMNIFRDYYNVTDDTDVYVSEIVDFVSEYRCFVHNGELKGIQYYSGDFTVFPQIEVINTIKRVYEEGLSTKLSAYTIDVGVLSTCETVLVELNDMWAIGAYGFDPEMYVRMVASRFKEIGRLNKVV